MDDTQSFLNDARRFLRYFLPGLTFFVEVAIFLFIPVILQTDLCFAQLLNLSLEFLKGLHAGVLLTVLLFGSVGLGYLFSILHHLLIHFLIDHREMLGNAIFKQRLKIYRYFKERGEEEIPSSDLSKNGSWIVVTGVWHEMKDYSALIKSANPRIESLTDIMHGSGTSFWGSIFAAVLWCLLYYKIYGVFWTWYMLIPLMMIIIHFWNFCNTIKTCQGVVEIVLSDELRLQKNMRNKPIEIIVSEREIKRK
jgi:hypothetical protein